MNFYQHQDRARRRTALLVAYFALAVALIALAVNAVAFAFFGATGDPPMTLAQYLDTDVWAFITLLVFGLILAGTLHTSFRLRGGGTSLADMLGARRIDPDTGEPGERRLVNVVEEMSIASGTPVPTLYVLDGEAGINAFVAGLRPTETVMVVTRGALESFSRDELQGVVAHEYSHIFNDDMRINLRLMGVVAGIVLIGQLGRFMLRSGTHGRGRGSGQVAIAGFAIFVIGAVGLFFGGLIKAAISRQREFLADASAVQFTRNPEGIAGALYRIREHTGGSLLDNAHAEDVSHFCFGESVHSAFSSLMATHPPLDARIRAIDPDYVERRRSAPAPAGEADTPGVAPPPPGATGFAGGGEALTPAAVAASVGTLRPDAVERGRRIHAALPPALLEAAHDADGACALLYALVLVANDAEERPTGLALLGREAGEDASAASARLAELVAAQPARARLPVLNLCLPALRTLEPAAREALQRRLRALVALDRRCTLFEFALLHVLADHLREDAGQAIAPRYFRYAEVSDALVLVYSVLARSGASREDAMRAAFDRAFKPFGEPGALAEPERCTLDALERALGQLEALSPLLKEGVIRAAADCVIHDGRVTAGEAELLQVLAVSLDCPLPPLPENGD